MRYREALSRTELVPRRQRWQAYELFRRYGGDLVGKRVSTMAIGDWTGGVCEVIKLQPDRKGAPEIVFQVRRLSDGAEMGVFDFEACEIVEDGKESAT